MSTIDASAGVRGQEADATLVAVRLLDPRTAWTRMKVRALDALRSIRTRAARRSAAIAQYVKAGWDRPTYRWVMRRAQTVTSLAGHAMKATLTWTGRGLRWLGRTTADVVGWFWPAAGDKLHGFLDNVEVRTVMTFEKVCQSVADVHYDFYEAATSEAATTKIRQLATPLAVVAGANLVSQGALMGIIATIPFIGLPLAAALGTGTGMATAAGAIFGIGLYDGISWLRADRADDQVTTEVKEAVEKPGEQVEVETREVMVDDEKVVVEIVGASELSTEEVQAIAAEHLAKQQADEEARVRELEAEVLTGKKKSEAKRHGPQPKGHGKKRAQKPMPSGSR